MNILRTFYQILYICIRPFHDNQMIYTVKIDDRTSTAKSVIEMLKSLQEKHDFIEVTGPEEIKYDEWTMRELESRYNATLKNKVGKSWDQLMQELSR